MKKFLFAAFAVLIVLAASSCVINLDNDNTYKLTLENNLPVSLTGVVVYDEDDNEAKDVGEIRALGDISCYLEPGEYYVGYYAINGMVLRYTDTFRLNRDRTIDIPD